MCIVINITLILIRIKISYLSHIYTLIIIHIKILPKCFLSNVLKHVLKYA